MRRTLTAMLLLVALGCVTNRVALDASKRNAAWIADVKLGQTRDEVRAILRKGPESTVVRVLTDGTNEEVWNYLTDYDNDMNTSITFRNGKVVELAETKWLGNGKFDEPLTTPARIEANLETLDTIVQQGMTSEQVLRLVGPAKTVVVYKNEYGKNKESDTYVTPTGKTFVVTFVRGVVSNVTRK